MNRGAMLAALCVLGCASGPHPALVAASRDFKCPVEQVERDEIYPNRQRVTGCDKEAIYVKDCSGYGVESDCRWARAKPAY